MKELQLQAEQKNKKLIYLSFASDKAYPHANVTVSNALKTQPRSRKVQAFVNLFHHALKNPNQESYVLSHGGNDDSKMSPVEKNPQDIVFFIDEVFLAELNGLQSWATNISSAYLQAKTKEKLYVVAGRDFGDLEGHTLIVHKALYGLRTSGIRWHKRLADCLRHMGFVPCKGEPDIWMRDRKDHWEYIDTYVDDLAISSKDPKKITSTLETKYGFELKGTGPITYHLGCDFIHDENGILCIQPKKYIEKMVDTYERLFGSKPKDVYTSPLEKGDHPEMDTSELLDEAGIQQYQSTVGALQWAASIGRLDITTAVMSLSGYRIAPRVGHLERCKRVYGYLWKMRHAMIRIRTEEPDYSASLILAMIGRCRRS